MVRTGRKPSRRHLKTKSILIGAAALAAPVDSPIRTEDCELIAGERALEMWLQDQQDRVARLDRLDGWLASASHPLLRRRLEIGDLGVDPRLRQVFHLAPK